MFENLILLTVQHQNYDKTPSKSENSSDLFSEAFYAPYIQYQCLHPPSHVTAHCDILPTPPHTQPTATKRQCLFKTRTPKKAPPQRQPLLHPLTL